ncbi:MAG: hypothetical protein Q9180_004643 [Flavoplaca navasiana]
MAQRPSSSSVMHRSRSFRETEDESGPISIEDYNYRGDSYHSTNIPTKYPLPLLYDNADSALSARLANITGLGDNIRHYLTAHRIPFVTIEIKMFSKPGYPIDGDTKRPGLLIWVDIRDAISTASLSAARRDISDFLETNGLGDFVVDILDPVRSYVPLIYPIKSTDSHTIWYKQVREELLHIVRTEIPGKCISLSLFYVGSSFGDAIPAVTLMVDPYAVYNWQMLSSRMRVAINKPGKPKDVNLEVEIFPGKRSNLEERPGKDLSDTFTPTPKVGSSIGVLGEEGGGTLGGFVELTFGNITHQGIMTNSHVTQPPSNAPPDVHDRYTKYGVQLITDHDSEQRTTVRYMADKDNHATKEACLQKYQQRAGHVDVVNEDGFSNLVHHQGSIAQTKATIERREMFGKDASYQEQLLQSLEREADDYYLKYRYLDTMPVYLSKTLVSSGKAVSQSRKIMDWAFVSVSGNTQPVNNISHQLYDPPTGNKLPTSEEMARAKLTPENYGSQYIYLPPTGGQPRKALGKIKADRWYFKKGRTTGLTAGICNGIESYIFMNETRYLHDSEGNIIRDRSPDQTVDTKSVEYTEEWVIINAHSETREFTSQRTFCDKGDYGAFVWDWQGRLCGLLFGDVSGWCGPKLVVQDPSTPTSIGFRPTISRPDEHMGGRYQGAGLVMGINDVVRDITRRVAAPLGVNCSFPLP